MGTKKETGSKASESKGTSSESRRPANVAKNQLESTASVQRGRPPREELSPLQLRGIMALLTLPTVAAAAAEIEVHPRTISRWLKEPAFVREYRAQLTELQMELWNQMLSVRGEAWNRFLSLMRSGDERIALRATLWGLDRMISVPPVLNQLTAPDVEGYSVIPRSLQAFLDDSHAPSLDGDGHAA